MDIKETSVIFENGGTFCRKNQLFNNPVEIISTTGQYKSGKLIDVTIIAEGADKFFDLDLLFFPHKSVLTINPMEQFSMSFEKMKHCAGRIQVVSSDFSNVGGCSIANLFNVNMTFQFKELCMIAVYQGDTTIITKPNSVALTFGYELGSCS
jgi:hypothetical protein